MNQDDLSEYRLRNIEKAQNGKRIARFFPRSFFFTFPLLSLFENKNYPKG